MLFPINDVTVVTSHCTNTTSVLGLRYIYTQISVACVVCVVCVVCLLLFSVVVWWWCCCRRGRSFHRCRSIDERGLRKRFSRYIHNVCWKANMKFFDMKALLYTCTSTNPHTNRNQCGSIGISMEICVLIWCVCVCLCWKHRAEALLDCMAMTTLRKRQNDTEYE